MTLATPTNGLTRPEFGENGEVSHTAKGPLTTRRPGNPFSRGIDREQFREGFRTGVQTMMGPSIGIAVWGLVTGVAMVNAGLAVPLALVLSLVAYAGSAQLAILPLLAIHAPIPIVWATAAIVNLRFAIFAAAQRKFFAGLSRTQRLLAAYVNGDLGAALFIRRYGAAPVAGTSEQWGFHGGVGLANYVVWHITSVTGILLGHAAPRSWGLDLAATLALVAVLIPMIVRIPMIAGIATTVVAAVLTAGWPMRLGLIASIAVGVCVALGSERFAPPISTSAPEVTSSLSGPGATT